MKDLFGNQKPIEIETDEWWFNGRIIRRQNDFRLPKWISFNDDNGNCSLEIHANKRNAITYALSNPCINPENLPHDYIGGLH